MRLTLVLLLLFISQTCFAEDPLETLNTVEDTVSTMQNALKAKATAEPAEAGPGAEAQVLYFVSADKIGGSDWVAAHPCPEGVTPAGNAAGLCLPQGGSAGGAHVWKSRLVSAGELRPGMVVLARDEATNDAWVMAKVTDLSEVQTGYVGITAPFKAQLKGLRLVVE